MSDQPESASASFRRYTHLHVHPFANLQFVHQLQERDVAMLLITQSGPNLLGQ